ncbi:ABC transporter ATP-binding protein [Sulfuricaulis limicola]|uniref:ABC transporter ATP-binding protein n=1 Tax=Sulfuricaulis limicola TaxID=1620215 RepID=A0A1B4XCW3_9GAMM|nr:ATP-binding cassette domain-containing protein [Sulfuricaulis limicola]BAV32610.1 ABC transporter ATP-binding protein [Sulfuricaulis limicola]
MPSVVEIEGLVKRYDSREVVRGIDLSVPAGRCFGVLGPNGAGKTTTLRLLLGQSPVNGGAIRVFGLPIPQAGRAVRARTGVVPQTDNLDPDFTVAENLRVYGRYFGIAAATLDARIRELLEFVGLTDRANARIATLSGGMKRRLTIARALINDPELVVLDEPTTGLDPQVRHMIWGRLRDLRQAGKTLLLTTHYMEEAERLCDELVIMDQGRILEQGTPAALIKKHAEPEVLEVRGEEQLARRALESAGDGRFEVIGDTYYYYTRDAREVVKRLEGMPGLTFLHRPANLEDVFLKLTGRELRD